MTDFDPSTTTADAAPQSAPQSKNVWRRMPWGTIVLIIAIVGVWSWLGRTAPTPAVFDESLTLASAVEAADEGLVFAVATADWCAPCQGYKRGALADQRVEQWITDNAVPVYIDVDKRPDDAASLGVNGIPATFLLKDGQIIASASGAMPADSLLGWLDENSRN